MKKRSFKKLISVFVVSALTIALCVGCAGDKEGSDSSSNIVGENTADSLDQNTENSAGTETTVVADEDSTLVFGIPQDLEDSLDPHKAVAAGTKEILFNIFEGLVKPTPDGDFAPAIAESYEISDDALVYTFKLRSGVKFHDGTLVTAEDVKFSIDKCADATDSSPLVPAYSNIKDTQIDGDNFIINLIEPDSEFIAYMTTAIIPKNNANPDTNPIGTGPYMYVSRSPQENFKVKKFDEYYDPQNAANITNVTFKIIGNMDTIAMELNSGAIDVVPRIPTAQADLLNDGFEIKEETMNLVQALYLNNAVEPLNNVQVRQALCYAIDPAEIMLFVSDGKGTEIGSSMFPAFGKYYDESLNDVYNQDIEKAKSLLAEAGYPNGFDLEITVASNYTQHVDTAQVLVEEFKAIGVNAKIKLVEWDSWLSDVYSGRQYESTVVGVDASSLTPSALLQRFTSTAHNNFINFSSAEYDEAFAKAKAAINDDEKTQYYKQCERILTEQAANVYIQDLPELVAISKKFTGYEFYPMYIQDVAKIKLAK